MGGVVSRCSEGRLEAVWIFSAFALVIVAVFSIRLFCAFTFPIPWNDESDFIAQAFELYRNGTLFVDGLNPDRVVMWMPPGYMILLAGVFKVFGYSFNVARWVSTLFFVAAYVVNLVMLRRCLRGGAVIAALLASLVAFLSPYSLAIANIARMEAVYTSLLLCALAITIYGKPWVGLAVVLATAVIHFNAIYFVIPYAAYFCSHWLRFRRIQINRIDMLALLIAAVMLLIYVAYVAMNWNAFVEDMRFQFWVKSWGPAFFGTKGKMIVAAAYLAVILQWVLLRRFSDSMFLSGFGAGFVLLYIYGQSMWYTFAESIGFYFLAMGFLVALSELGSAQKRAIISLFLILSSTVLVYFSIFRVTPQFAPLWPRTELFKRDFVASSELEKISKFIQAASAGTKLRFGHSGIEPFFFQQLADHKLLWVYRVHSVTQQRPWRQADYSVRCDSALLPKYILKFELGDFQRKGEDIGCEIFAL